MSDLSTIRAWHADPSEPLDHPYPWIATLLDEIDRLEAERATLLAPVEGVDVEEVLRLADVPARTFTEAEDRDGELTYAAPLLAREVISLRARLAEAEAAATYADAFETYRHAITTALNIDPASCAEDVATEASDAIKAATIHRRLNERVAGALGLLDVRRDPETGEDYLPSWHDMPERVAALRAMLDMLIGDASDLRLVLSRPEEAIGGSIRVDTAGPAFPATVEGYLAATRPSLYIKDGFELYLVRRAGACYFVVSPNALMRRVERLETALGAADDTLTTYERTYLLNILGPAIASLMPDAPDWKWKTTQEYMEEATKTVREARKKLGVP